MNRYKLVTNTMEVPSTRTERRRQRTRKQLLEAAQHIILKHGYEATSADAVTNFADLGRSTFYNHFENKYDAVLAMLTDHYREYGVSSYIPMDETKDRAESVARSALKVFTAMASDPLTRQLIHKPRLLALAIVNSQMDFVIKDFTEGIMQSRFNFSISMNSLVTILNWSYVGMIISAIEEEKIDEIAQEWVCFLLSNIGLSEEEAKKLAQLAAEK